jgi:hypothetical protein
MAFSTEVEQLRSHISSALTTMYNVFEENEGVEELLEAISELEHTDRLLDTIENEEVITENDVDNIKSHYEDVRSAVDSVYDEMDYLARALEDL